MESDTLDMIFRFEEEYPERKILRMNIASYILIATNALMGAMKKPMPYLDPGTGSFLLQLLAAGVLGGLFIFRSSLKKVKNFFLRLLGHPVGVEEPEDEE